MRRLLVIAAMASSTALAQNSATVDGLSNNQQGSNITNNSNSNNQSATTNYNAPGSAPGSQPPPSAIAPSLMGGGSDSCLIPITGAVSSSFIGISGGTYVADKQCEMIKLSRALDTAGLKVSAISVLCADPRVFRAMLLAQTPCPFFGMIGKQALIGWAQNPQLRPDWTGDEKDLFPIYAPGKASTVGDSDASLSDRFRPSKRSGANAATADGSK